MSSGRRGLIDRFVEHRVAANLLMVILIMMGSYSLIKLNTQFLPTFDLNFISVNVVWTGANAADIERSITTPLELELRDLDDVKEMNSISREGVSNINIEFKQGADMTRALDDVKERVALVRDLPQEAETPIIKSLINYEPIAKLILYGANNLNELRFFAHDMERQLLDAGIAKITITGLPEEEIAIQVPSSKLAELGLSLDQVANLIRQRSQDIPAGTIGKADLGTKLRSLNQQRSAQGFANLPLITDNTGHILRVSDIATVERRSRERQVTLFYEGKPAIELALLRAEKSSALKSAKIMQEWHAKIQQQLPPNIQVKIYDENWRYIQQRINILLENGILGFALIIAILFLLLNRHVAFWVAMGIPISMLAAMFALYIMGGTINMISMFAFIMALGIIVDDTIVVGEEALTLIKRGKDALTAAREAAYKMLAPIMASSLTTIAAFLPLMFISGIIGKILLQIPIVVVCVIIASLIECFFILPGHLHHSMRDAKPSNGMRQRIDGHFAHFRDHRFRRLVTVAVKHSPISLSLAVAALIMCLGIVMGGRINFTFFPSPDAYILRANVEFTAGTPDQDKHQFMSELKRSLIETNQQLATPEEPILKHLIHVNNRLASERRSASPSVADEYAHLYLQLTEPDQRAVTNTAFINAWRSRIKLPPNIENFTITEPTSGPPGKEIDISITGPSWSSIKAAAQDMKLLLGKFSGVQEITDDLPLGQQEYIFEPSVVGKALGINTEALGRQLRAAFNGDIIQIFHEPNEEVEVRVTLPPHERDQLNSLEYLPIMTPDGQVTPLMNVVTLTPAQGLSILRHTNTQLTARVTADIIESVTNANKVLTDLKQGKLAQIESTHGVKVQLKGRAEDQAQTITDMKLGASIALILIYVILAWVFTSYSLPIVIILTIPLGVIGAILGHLLMGKDMTILSLFGIFGLAGIVINDSIILVNRYLQLRTSMPTFEAVIESTCQRLRAVLLTSLTTIAGLAPLLFETSRQAQFLIPMAISITFGLLFATALILLIIPCLLYLHQTRTTFITQKRRDRLLQEKALEVID